MEVDCRQLTVVEFQDPQRHEAAVEAVRAQRDVHEELVALITQNLEVKGS